MSLKGNGADWHNTPGCKRRRRSRAAIRRDQFLRHFAVTGNISRACRASEIPRRTLYHWLESDEDFRGLYNDVLQDAHDALEGEARRRAVDGVLKSVYYRGKKVGAIRKYSDGLLIRLLRMRRPEVFGERHAHFGKGGAPEVTTVQVSYHSRD